ncbi:MAG: PHP domain-containing protein [Clostridia bacterium]|nr:PHP domain-containing protein [Clostridia bacterium]MDE7328937.1 PHP domain-containing protein [Clostridia bacterium]
MGNIKITADYHSHTTYSHGKGSVADNARVASQKGLDYLAITDHAVRHPFIGVKRKEFPTIRADIDVVQKSFPELKLLFGLEANILGQAGDLDVSEEDIEKLDILLAGYHLTSFPYKVKDFFTITCSALKRYVFKSTKAEIARNTKMYVNAIKNNKIDIVTHPGFRLDIDYFELGKVCADYGTYVELSSRHRTPDERNIEGLLKSDCLFVLNSDAHKSENVGECGFALELAEKFAIPEDRIANANHKSLILRSKDRT